MSPGRVRGLRKALVYPLTEAPFPVSPPATLLTSFLLNLVPPRLDATPISRSFLLWVMASSSPPLPDLYLIYPKPPFLSKSLTPRSIKYSVSSSHMLASLSLCLTHHILSPTFWGTPYPFVGSYPLTGLLVRNKTGSALQSSF